jgi:hypothetical protein
MNWLQDKKNLPIVIAITVAVMLGAGYFLYSQIKASSPEAVDTSSAPQTRVAQGQSPDASPVGSPGASTAPPAASTSAPTAPTAPTSNVRPGGGPTGAPAQPGKTQVAAMPMPKEAFRDDPFLPIDYHPPVKMVKGRMVIIIPEVPRIFLPKPPVLSHINPNLIPQPPRRVAGIIYSSRVTALLQTPDGWETVRPGDKLRDGTMVDRIERDRVVLRTTDDHPRLVEVKLAAAAIGSSSGGSAVAAPATPAAGSRRPKRIYNPSRNDM